MSCMLCMAAKLGAVLKALHRGSGTWERAKKIWLVMKFSLIHRHTRLHVCPPDGLASEHATGLMRHRRATCKENSVTLRELPYKQPCT